MCSPYLNSLIRLYPCLYDPTNEYFHSHNKKAEYRNIVLEEYNANCEPSESKINMPILIRRIRTFRERRRDDESVRQLPKIRNTVSSKQKSTSIPLPQNNPPTNPISFLDCPVLRSRIAALNPQQLSLFKSSVYNELFQVENLILPTPSLIQTASTILPTPSLIQTASTILPTPSLIQTASTILPTPSLIQTASTILPTPSLIQTASTILPAPSLNQTESLIQDESDKTDHGDGGQLERFIPTPSLGLRGKELGTVVETMLVIPPAVFKQVASHIKNIKEIADSHYIKVNYVSRQKKLDLLNGGGIKLEDTMELVELDNNDDDVVMTNVKLEVVYNETDSGVEQFLAIIKIRTGITDSMDAEASAPQQGKLEDQISAHEPEKVLSLREKRDFKYNYDNIFTSTFHEKLDQELAENLTVIKNTEATESLSKSFFTRYQDMIDRYKYKEMLKFRVNLPVHKYVKKLLHVIHHNSIVVITGKAGSGKSTQVPQLILDKALIDQKSACTKIMVTQPSRIAASSLAERVAAERDEKIGFSVGYAARLEGRESQQRGSIMYVTKEILLAELEANPGLINYSHIILDEVDERDANVDLSMMALKEVLKKRKDLKLILMGATQNTAALSAYFDNCPVVEITSLVHPVDVYYLDDIFDLLNYKFDDQPQNRDKVIQHMAKIGLEHDTDIFCDSIKRGLLDHRGEEINLDVMLRLLMCLIHCRPGAILVILPSIGVVTRLLGAMKDSKQFPDSHFRVYPLHSKLPSLEQKIFERPPYHVRKIIVATDIADTSITVDDVVYVIDCGRVELSRGNAKGNIDTLQVEWASKANLQLRRDRAGRCGPGVCYHLVTSHQASQLDESLLPELQRSNLLNAVLKIKKLRLGKAEEAFRNVISPPDVKTIQRAVKRLQKIGALNQDETLTPLGWHLARLPVHPAAGKLMLLGALFGCLDRAASVAAVWGYKDPFMLVTGKNSEIDKVKSHFALDEPSDHVALSEAIIDWECRRDQKSFCSDNFLSNDTMEVLSDIKQELTEDLKRIGFLPSGDVQWENRNAKNLNLFKAVVAAALYPNVAMVSWTDLQWKGTAPSVSVYTDEGSVYIHTSSVCAFHPHVVPSSDPSKWQAKAKWLVYNCLKGPFLKGVTQAHTLPMLFFGEFDVTYDENFPDDCFFWLATYKVRCDLQTADMLFELRSLLNHVLASKVEVGSERAAWCSSEFKEQVLNAVIQLMIVEDEEVQPKEECVADSNEPLPQKNNNGIEE